MILDSAFMKQELLDAIEELEDVSDDDVVEAILAFEDWLVDYTQSRVLRKLHVDDAPPSEWPWAVQHGARVCITWLFSPRSLEGVINGANNAGNHGPVLQEIISRHSVKYGEVKAGNTLNDTVGKSGFPPSLLAWFKGYVSARTWL